MKKWNVISGFIMGLSVLASSGVQAAEAGYLSSTCLVLQNGTQSVSTLSAVDGGGGPSVEEGAEMEEERPEVYARALGLSCQDLFNARDAFGLITKISVVPLIFAETGMKQMILNQLLAMGIVIDAPILFTITVVTATGSAAIAVIANQELKDCEKLRKEEEKQKLIREIQTQFNLGVSKDVRVEVK